jgi:hypothetical protein
MTIGSPDHPVILGELDGLGADISAVAGSLDISALAASVVLVTTSTNAYIGAGQATGTMDATKGVVVTPDSGGIFLSAKGRKYIHHLRVSADGKLCVVRVR